jgi:HEAT repeat protein
MCVRGVHDRGVGRALPCGSRLCRPYGICSHRDGRASPSKECFDSSVTDREDVGPARPSPAFTGVVDLHSPAAVSELVALATHPDLTMRASVAMTLGRYVERRVAPTLAYLARDDDEPVRTFAISALGYVGDRSVVPELLAMAEDPDPRIRWTVASALGCLRDASAREVLEVLERDEESIVRMAAGRALAGLPRGWG